MGRLRYKPWALEYLENSKIVITDPIEYKWSTLFKKKQDLWLEIGMGKGRFTIEQSKVNEDKNILGIEKFPSVQVVPVKIVEEKEIDNLKFVSGDASRIDEWFDKGTIDKIFINFPDPWPKERHSKRRLLSINFLNKYYEILKKDSYIEFKTDQLSLFEFALEEVKKTKFKIKNEIRDLHKENKDIIMTEYEKKFSKMGNKIYYVEFIK